MGLKRAEWEARGGKIRVFHPEFGLPMIINDERPGRNDMCPCGSKKKYKKCCLNRMPEPPVLTEEQKAMLEKQHAVQQALASGDEGVDMLDQTTKGEKA
jgi:hypothetical protein